MKPDRTQRDKNMRSASRTLTLCETRLLPDLPNSSLLLELSDCVEDFILVLDSELLIIMANRSMTDFFGYSEHELVTKHPSLLVVPGERKRLVKFIRETKERRGGETVFLTRFYRKVRVRFSVSPVLNIHNESQGYLIVGRQMPEEDSGSIADPTNGLANRILKGLAEPVFIVDFPSEVISDCNEPAIIVSGFSREELVGRRYRDCVESDEDRYSVETFVAQADEAYAKTGIFVKRVRFPRKNYASLPCDCVSMPVLKTDGSTAFKIFVLLDRSREEAKEALIDEFVDRVHTLASTFNVADRDLSKNDAPIRLSDLGFTSRQIEIARLAALGASSKDIGFRLGIAESTVKNHLAVMYRKLGTASRVAFIHALTEQRVMLV